MFTPYLWRLILFCTQFEGVELGLNTIHFKIITYSHINQRSSPSLWPKWPKSWLIVESMLQVHLLTNQLVFFFENFFDLLNNNILFPSNLDLFNTKSKVIWPSLWASLYMNQVLRCLWNNYCSILLVKKVDWKQMFYTILVNHI